MKVLHKLLLATCVLLTAAGMIPAAFGQSDVSWHTTDGVGASSTGGSYSLVGTMGQPDAGVMNGGTYTLLGGFWPGVALYSNGDLNCDGLVNLFDIDAFVLALTTASEEPPFESYYLIYPACDPLLADANGDGSVNLFDIDPFVELLTGT